MARASKVVKSTRWSEPEPEKYMPFGLMLLLIGVSLFAIVVCAQRIIKTFTLSMDFVVEDSYQVCEQPLNNRCITHYTVKKSDGKEDDFVPFGYQFEEDLSLSDQHILKTRCSFIYQINGVEKPWPYLWQHIFVLLAGMAGIIFWFYLIRTRKLFFGRRKPH